jgi:hypothetical protein
MDDARRGIITFDSGRGWYFAEDSEDGIAVFVHMRYSADEKYLHLSDTITFQRINSVTKPGKFEAREIRRTGHCISRQVSGDNRGARGQS